MCHKGGVLLPALFDMHHQSPTLHLSKVHSTTAMRLVSVMWPKVAGLFGRIFWSMWALHVLDLPSRRHLKHQASRQEHSPVFLSFVCAVKLLRPAWSSRWPEVSSDITYHELAAQLLSACSSASIGCKAVVMSANVQNC